MSKALLKAIAPATKVATALERYGPVLSLCIHRNRIDLGVASSYLDVEHIERLTPIPTVERAISKECIEQLHEVVQDHDICGFVVAWPLHHDTGKMGASCGRVLFTLESILQQTASCGGDIFSRRRPACLWHPFFTSGTPSSTDGGTGTTCTLPPQEDEWGRCPLHARISNRTIYRASVERYHEDEKMDAASVWQNFSEVNWPHLAERQRHRKVSSSSSYRSASSSSCNLVSDWRETAMMMTSAGGC